MNNELFLEYHKNVYESLKYFSIDNNKLKLNYNGEYFIYLQYVLLSNLNPNIYLLNPIEIFQIIYMLELLPKKDINEKEIAFIKTYTTKYLKLNDERLESNSSDNNRIWCLEIPINFAYDIEYENNPGSKVIKNTINSHQVDINSGKEKQARLVLTPNNPNYIKIEEDNYIEDLKDAQKAGFTTIILITAAVVCTCLYMALFIAGK